MQQLEAQVCPFCSKEQEIRVHGHRPEGTGYVKIDETVGYSFCNCKNVFFTDFKNMKQSLYESKDYSEKYSGVGEIIKKHLTFYLPYFQERGKFLELGTVNEALIEHAKELGFDAYGSDYSYRESKNKMIFGDFEKEDFSEHYGTFSVLFASHIFEHFKSPLLALNKCNDLLCSGGRIFLAMPDTYFIDWKNPYAWGHWHIEEHYTLWDMNSWVDEMKQAGFKILFKTHNTRPEFVCSGDFHVIAEKI